MNLYNRYWKHPLIHVPSYKIFVYKVFTGNFLWNQPAEAKSGFNSIICAIGPYLSTPRSGDESLLELFLQTLDDASVAVAADLHHLYLVFTAAPSRVGVHRTLGLLTAELADLKTKSTCMTKQNQIS